MFAIGVGLLVVATALHVVVIAAVPSLSTAAFLLGLLGMGIAVVSGTWYVSLFLRELF